jgi:hypothetical protein|nr:hypothetical protein OH826_35810 [Streptomyces sp. NBC_00899]
MGEPKNLGMAAAVAGGYFLGRTRRGQMALTAAALLAGRGLRPGGLVTGAVRKVPGVPAARGGDQAERAGDEANRGCLSKAAASVANRGVTALAGTLRERTEALSGEADGTEDGGADEAPAGEPERAEPKRRARPAQKTAGARKSATARSQGTRSPRTPAAKKRSQARRASSTSGRAHKTTSSRTRRER